MTYKIWADVLQLINKITTKLYSEKGSATYLRKHAMKEAYKSEEYKNASAEFKQFKANNPTEWKKLQDAYTANKSKKKVKNK